MSLLDDTWSRLASVVRLGRGTHVLRGGARRQPEKVLELWEFEACPYCRKAEHI